MTGEDGINGTFKIDKTQTLARLLFTTYSKVVEAAKVNSSSAPIVREVWFAVLGTKDERIILRTFDTLHEALDRLEAAMSRAPSQTEDTIVMVSNLVRTMREWMSFGVQQSSSTNLVNKTPVDQLRFLLFVEPVIAANFPELHLSRIALHEIANKLKEMDEILADPEIPPVLKAMLHELVMRMRWAVQHYDVVGVDGLLRQVRAAELTLIHLSKLGGDSQASSWVASCFAKICKISEVISVALKGWEKLSEAASAVSKHLPGSSGSIS